MPIAAKGQLGWNTATNTPVARATSFVECILGMEQSHLTGEKLRPGRGRDFSKAPAQFRRKQNCQSKAEELDFLFLWQ